MTADLESRLDDLELAIQRAAVVKRRLEVLVGFLTALVVWGWLR